VAWVPPPLRDYRKAVDSLAGLGLGYTVPGAPESSRRAPDPSFPHCGAHAPVAILRSSTGTLRAAVESHVAVEALRRVHRAVGAGRDTGAGSGRAHGRPGRTTAATPRGWGHASH